MLLGKRPRPSMKRTTSLSEFTFDTNTDDGTGPAPPSSNHPHQITHKQLGFGGPQQLDHRFLATSKTVQSPRPRRRASVDFLETSHFLRSCSLCKRRLFPGRDIYMYRGDSAFCSVECRQQQMNQDERKEKCSLASKKEAIASSSAAASKVSAKGETVAAV